MAKSGMMTNNEKKNGMVKLKIIAEVFHKTISLGKKRNSFAHDSTNVPEDVKQGHFAVVAECGDEPKRFVVPLSYLTDPRFLMLLEQAAEEYGFDRKGALRIPCSPCELERILADEQGQEEDSTNANLGWGSCGAMIQTY